VYKCKLKSHEITGIPSNRFKASNGKSINLESRRRTILSIPEVGRGKLDS
jgi:hypothetical protein